MFWFVTTKDQLIVRLNLARGLSQEQLVETWTDRQRTPHRFSADPDTCTNTASGTTDALA
jgi:hypothetical protein